jgi:hypothetical protein
VIADCELSSQLPFWETYALFGGSPDGSEKAGAMNAFANVLSNCL